MAPTYIRMLINKNVHNSVPKPQKAEMELKLLAASHQVKVVQNECSELLLWTVHLPWSWTRLQKLFPNFHDLGNVLLLGRIYENSGAVVVASVWLKVASLKRRRKNHEKDRFWGVQRHNLWPASHKIWPNTAIFFAKKLWKSPWTSCHKVLNCTLGGYDSGMTLRTTWLSARTGPENLGTAFHWALESRIPALQGRTSL